MVLQDTIIERKNKQKEENVYGRAILIMCLDVCIPDVISFWMQ